MNILVNILVVDDNKGDLELLGTAMRDANIENYHLFAFPESFLTAVAQSIPAVCIIDHQLGGIMGLEVMKSVLQIAPHSFIIILSGFGDIYEFMHYANDGADRFVLKGEIDYLQKLIGFVNEGIEDQKKYLSLKEGIQKL